MGWSSHPSISQRFIRVRERSRAGVTVGTKVPALVTRTKDRNWDARAPVTVLYAGMGEKCSPVLAKR